MAAAAAAAATAAVAAFLVVLVGWLDVVGRYYVCTSTMLLVGWLVGC